MEIEFFFKKKQKKGGEKKTKDSSTNISKWSRTKTGGWKTQSGLTSSELSSCLILCLSRGKTVGSFKHRMAWEINT